MRIRQKAGFALLAAALSAPVSAQAQAQWSGFYVGVNAGYAWSDADMAAAPVFANPVLGNSGPASVASARAATDSLSANGFMGGVQAGYNFRFGGNLVLGVETDIQYMSGNDSRLKTGTAVGLPERYDSANSVDLEYLGTLRARLGFLATPTMLAYITGGLAYGSADFAITQQLVPAAATRNPFSSGAELKYGWTLGGGLEWQFSQSLTLKAEYLYYDLGSKDFTLSQVNAAGTPFIASRVEADMTGHIARVGLNFHLQRPAVEHRPLK